MLLIHTATVWEAEPLIRWYALKRRASYTGPGRLFERSAVQLLAGGIGPARTEASMLALQDLDAPAALCAACNIGLCGAAPHFPIGSLYSASVVTDAATEIPFQLLPPPGPQLAAAGLRTYAQPVRIGDPAFPALELVDMEASVFCRLLAGRQPPVAATVLKIVSDHLQPQRFSKSYVCGLIEQQLPLITAVIDQLPRE